MINKNYPERIRAALKKEEPKGTLIDSKPYRTTKGGCYEPVRTAIGLTLGNSLFIGGCNLIVEGIADQIIITAFSRLLAKQGDKEFINLQDTCITPAGGVDNVLYLSYLCNTEEMKPVILLDSDREGDIVYKRIESEKVIKPNSVVRVRDASPKKGGSIFELEDLIEDEYYHKAVLDAYKEMPGINFAKSIPNEYAAIIEKPTKTQGKQPLQEGQGSQQVARGKRGTEDNIKPKGRTKIYDDYFKSKEWGGFDKVLVAREISQRIDNEDLPGETTILNFKQLSKEVNNKLRQGRT